MSFLTIPEDVVKKDILPLLGWNDLLRLRRVSLRLKEVVTSYMKEHPELAPEIEINEEGKTFGGFLKMDIPTTKLFINNFSGDNFYEDSDTQDMSTFLSKYASFVTHLRVTELALYVCDKEWDFLDSFVNLEAFEAHHLGVGTRGENIALLDFGLLEKLKRVKAYEDPRFHNRIRLDIPPIPDVFCQLKYLKIGQMDRVHFTSLTNRHDGFLFVAPKLEYVGLPLSLFWESLLEGFWNTMKKAFLCLGDYIGLDKRPDLKTVDFFSYYHLGERETKEMVMEAAEVFPKLLQLAMKHNVKLLNVGALWFGGCQNYPADIGKPVGSLVNIHHWVYRLDMPNLERVEIKATSQCVVGQTWKLDRPNWPALQVLDINVDSDLEETKTLFRFLFEDVHRLALKELRLNFVKGKEQVAIPKMEDVKVSCPNLKKLTLVNWPGKNKALISLWEGLPGLEEITLDKCKNVGNVTFVGLDTKNPVFFKLKKLRKLTLRGVDQMPKITDLLFSLVIQHLKLNHFEITAQKPLENVSFTGINSLLEAEFAESIEKFPFVGWSLQALSVEEFQALGKKFRSSDML